MIPPRLPLLALALALAALAALPARAERLFKDRLRCEEFPRELEEGSVLTIKGVPQGKWKYGWCAVTWPDGTTAELHDAEVTGGKFTQRLTLDKGKGKYVVEFLVQGDLGPAVGAIYSVYVGVPKEEEKEPDYRWDTRPTADIERDVFDQINAFRAERRLPVLQWDERLAQIGREHCEDMIENRYFAHVSPKHGDMAARARVKYGWTRATWGLPDRLYTPKPDGPVFVGENLAYDNCPAGAVDGWLGSPGHRAAMINRFVAVLGVGARKYEANENGFLVRRIYFVATFGLIADANVEAREKEAAAREAEARATPAFEKAQEEEARDMPAAVDLYREVAAKHAGTECAKKAQARADELTGSPEWPKIVEEAKARREARAWIERARMLLDNKKPENARAWLQKVIDRHPGTPEADEAARLMKTLGE